MADIGKAYVQILPSMEGISSNLSSVLSGAAGSAGTTASSSFGAKFTRGLATVGGLGAAALTAATTAAVSFGKSAVTAGAEFDSAMSQVAATMGYTTDELNDSTSKASQNMETLRNYAQEMGSSTAFSATEAAEALNYMALAGYDADTSMSVLPNVLNLASAGSMDLASASDMVTDAASALNMTLEDGSVDIEQVTAMVDQMAATASRSNTSVSQLGDAILTIGATAANCAGGTEELSTILGVLGDNGIKGSEGGTHLRNMILSLQDAAEGGKVAMGDFSVEIYDSEGNMRDMVDIIGDMQTGLDGMSQESKDAIVSGVFNKTDLASVNALLNTSTDRFNELRSAISDSSGAAEQMAAVQLDNLEGDVTLFKSALEGAKIAISDNLTPTLREFVSFGTEGLSQITESFNTGGMDAAVSTFGDLLSQFQTKITTMLPDIVSGGASILTSLVSGLVQNASTIATSAVSIVTTLTTTIMTLLPQLLDAGLQILAGIISGIAENLPNLIESGISMIEEIGNAIIDNIDLLIDASIQLLDAVITGVTENIDDLVDAAVTIVSKLLTALLEEAPTLIEAGTTLVLKLVNGLIDAIPNITTSGHDLISNFVTAISENLPQILEVGIDMLLQLTAGLIEAIPDLISETDDIIIQMQSIWLEFDWIAIGKSIITGIVNGLTKNSSLIVDAAKNAAKSAYESACNFLNINSPSKLFRDNVGAAIPEGMAIGIEQNEGYVTKAMNDLGGTTVDSLDYNTITAAATYDGYATGDYATSDGLDGTKISLPIEIDLGDTKLKEIIYEYMITKTGDKTTALKLAQGGAY